MKRLFLIVILLMLFGVYSSVCASSEVKAVYGETYLCGDSFEVIIQGEPIFTTMITRHAAWDRPTFAQAGKYDILFAIRLKIRNLTSEYWGGFKPESFKLVGYVRGRAVEYTPEVMSPYDYGIERAYSMYDKMHYMTYPMATLRVFEMQLVYRVNPNLVDWELHMEPHETNWIYTSTEKPLTGLEPCSGVFQFITVWDERTREMIKYYR